METAAARRRVLLLMPTSTYHAHDFIAAAAKLQVDVTVGTNARQALQDRVPGSTLELDFDDLDAAADAIAAHHRRFPVAAVVAADDETTALAAAAAEALDLPHNPVEAVLTTRDKSLLRRSLHHAGLPSPRHLSFGFERGAVEAAAARALAQGVPFPCVLKPTFLSASRGVIRADTPEQFMVAARRIAAILDDPDTRRAGGHARVILVEEYIPGDEYAVEAMLADGVFHPLAVFDKPDPLVGPYFEETIYVTPSMAPASRRREILATVERCVGALGLQEGPVHAELRVNDSGAYVVDVAARAIGGLCSRVLRFGTGVSLEELIVRHALDEDFSAYARQPGAAGVMMIPIPQAGVLRGVEGIDEARRVAGISEVTMTINPGQRLVPLPEGNRYLGFIFARATTTEAAERALREAHSRLRIRVSGPRRPSIG